MNLQDISKQVKNCFPEINLKNTLDKEFALCYFLHLPYSDIENMEVTEFNWFYQRLIKQKEQEKTTVNEVT